MEKRSLFQSLDEQVFKQINTFKNSKVFQQYNDLISSLTDKQQKFVSIGISYLIIMLPAIITFFIFLGNVFTSMERSEKEAILQEIDRFNSTKNEIATLGRNVITPYNIANKNSLQNRMSTVTNAAGIASGNVRVVSFESVKEMNEMKQSRGELNFKNFSTKDLSKFLSQLVGREKFRISSLDVTKSKDGKSLKGTIEIIYFGKK